MADPQTTPIYSGHLDPGPRNNDDAEAGFWEARGASIAESFAESTTEEFGLAGQIRQADVGTKGAIVPSASAEQATEPRAPALTPSLNFRNKVAGSKFDVRPEAIEPPSVPLYQYERIAPTTPEIPIEAAKAQVKAAKLDKAITLPSAPSIHQGALDIMMEDAQARAARQETIEAGPKGFIPSVLDASTSMFIGAVDPLNAAAFSVPVIGEARYGYLLEKAGQSVLARAGVRAAVGGAQGLLGSTLLTPIDWASKTGEGRDYTFTDALSNMIQNAGAGALFHAGPAALGDVYSRFRGRPLAQHAPPPTESIAEPAQGGGLETAPEAPTSPPPGAAPPRPPISTGIPMVDDVLEEPSVRQAIETPQIDRDHDVPYGAGSAQEGPGKTFVDRHVPHEAEIDGVTFDPAVAVNVHEQAERFAMERGMSYEDAHTEIATPAEKAWVEANIGPNAWDAYTHLWDGWLSHIEHEKAENPPPDLYTKPYPHDQRLALETKGQDQAGVAAGAEAVRPGEPPVARETQSPMAAAFDALPDRAKEDMARIVNADLIAGRPVQGAEVLQAAAQSDPRIAQALAAFERDPSAQAVLRDVRDKLIATGMTPEEATENATIWAARYGARANRLGIGDAMSLYQKEGVAIGEGAETKQPDLLDLAKQPGGRSFNQPLTAPTFHSAVERAVTNSKLTKGSPEQWLATVKNTPGVKPEEMKWLGLEDWLKEQGGPVTKDQVAQYVNDNNIQVKEVEHGTVTRESRAAQAMNQRLIEKYGGLAEAFQRWTPAEQQTFDELHAATFGSGPSADIPTKFGSYTLPGGENYRELLLTLPTDDRAASVARQTRLAEIDREVAKLQASLPTEQRLAEVRTELDGLNQTWQALAAEKGSASPEATAAFDRLQDATKPLTDADTIQRQIKNYTMQRGLVERETKDRTAYHSSHWDEPNVLAHIRFDDRTVDGQKALHIAEVQSDWHQAGRRYGYAGEPPPGYTLTQGENGRWGMKDAEGRSVAAGDTREDALRVFQEREHSSNRSVPDAPFKTSWPELSMKRMIRYAAENGYDRITWDTGATNAERYDLSKQIQRIQWITHPHYPGFGSIDAFDHSGKNVLSRQAKPEELPDLIGKDVAERLVNADASETPAGGSRRTLEGLDLKVGGEGMHGFYDKILPTAVNKLVKKFGGKVESAELQAVAPENARRVDEPDARALADHSEDAAKLRSEQITVRDRQRVLERTGDQHSNNEWNDLETRRIQIEDEFEKIEDRMIAETRARLPKTDKSVHSLAITHAMKEAALSEGFPLFQSGTTNPSLRGRITLEDNRAIINLFENADASTFMHESAHLWLDEIARDAATEGVPQALKEDFGTILRWLGADRAEDITVTQHEQFATGFEQYLASGRAPSTALERAFSAFKDWLTAIYRDLRGLGTPIGDDVRGVFDRMLTPDEHERIDQASPPPRPRRPGNVQNLASQPQTLIGFIKSRGGLKDSSEFRGRDYRASYPGLINNKRGMSLDYAREAAAEAGYLGGDQERAMSETAVSDFLNALENHPTYSVHDEGRVAEWKQRQEFAEYKRSVDKEKANIAEFLHRYELPLMSDEAMAEAADLLISGEESSYDNAIERAEIMLYNRDVEREAQLTAAESRNATSANGQEPGQQPATAGGSGNRPRQTGAAPGARQAVSDPRQARREAEWRAIAERSHPAAGSDTFDGSIAEDEEANPPAPASIEAPDKQMSALDKSIAEAEEQWKALEPYLDEDERATVAKALETAGADEQAHADALKDLLNCMIVAEG